MPLSFPSITLWSLFHVLPLWILLNMLKKTQTLSKQGSLSVFSDSAGKIYFNLTVSHKNSWTYKTLDALLLLPFALHLIKNSSLRKSNNYTFQWRAVLICSHTFVTWLVKKPTEIGMHVEEERERDPNEYKSQKYLTVAIQQDNPNT